MTITIIIPTLDEARGRSTGQLALATAGTDARVIVVNGPKRGFTKTVNDGMRQVEKGDVCILNDDVAGFPMGWLAALEKGLHSRPKFGIAGPSGKSATAPANTGKPGMNGLQACRQLPFWCALLRRKMIDQIGILDERFIHYCSDNEYCARAKRAGWSCVWVRSVFLKHEHKASGFQSAWRKHDRAEFLRKTR